MKITTMGLALALFTTPAFACGSLSSGDCGSGFAFKYQSRSTTETIKTWYNDTVLGWSTRLVTQSPPPPRPQSRPNSWNKLGTYFFRKDTVGEFAGQWWMYYQVSKVNMQKVTGPDRAMLHGYTDIKTNQNYMMDGTPVNRDWTYSQPGGDGTKN